MFTIRNALVSDAQVLTDLGRETFLETFESDNSKDDLDIYMSETFTNEKQARELQDPMRFLQIARDGDEVAGFLHLVWSAVDPSVTGEKPIELLKLYVLARWHGKGVGAALMEKAIETAKSAGADVMWLGVWERNHRAQAFYKKYAFEIVGSHSFRVGTDDQNDFIIQRSLKD